MSITIYPSQFNMREDGSYEQLPAIKGETGAQGVPGVGALPGGTAGQVPVKQSGADYDVAWEDIGWAKLWENASPSSSFSAQTVPLDLSAYYEVQVVYYTGTYWATYVSLVMTEFGKQYVLNVPGNDGRTSNRTAALATTGITFGDAKYRNTYAASSETTDNKLKVPVKIYAR